MLQASKVVKSREDWKEKAVYRAYKIREFKKGKKRYLKKIVELKQSNHELKQAIKDKKKF